ncbi:toll/interleukin-1 receptor domain-containing protein [Clostridium gasigenes]|uniref:Toll/interleukin-1 receptor domain-containing protein n=1 Tax=Clostridium gasigenes TaxID=94869 RepID=A0A7X0SHF2_9CLOT|nr:toll/interleukin-1 receptor domain-containing protein [Clostridium gasigenes]MBB6715571.1 toll/interleukin-1 receptor domain-containing protein [Clostridium gasigenes]
MRVFISHSSKDKEIIDKFVDVIKYLGVEVFYSSKNETNSIEAGECFYKKILKEITECNFIIAMLSEDFYKSTPSQIEMGMAYALKKDIKPIIIDRNSNYRDLLKGIFTSNNRAYNIYDKEEMSELLSGMTENPAKRIIDIYKCAERIGEISLVIESSFEKEDIRAVIKEHDNSILNFLDDGEFNTNEYLFLKYMWENRKYNLEYGWQLEKGAHSFKNWINNNYELIGEKDAYKNILDHFKSLGLLDEMEYTSNNNVRMYKLKDVYIRELSKIYKNNPGIINDECDNAIFIMPF